MKRIGFGKKSLVVMTEEEYQDTRDILHEMAVRLHMDQMEEKAWFGVEEVSEVLGPYYIQRQTERTNELIEQWDSFISKYPRK